MKGRKSVAKALGYNSTIANWAWSKLAANNSTTLNGSVVMEKVAPYIANKTGGIDKARIFLAKRMTINETGLAEALHSLDKEGPSNQTHQCWANAPHNATQAEVHKLEQFCETGALKHNKAKCKKLPQCQWD